MASEGDSGLLDQLRSMQQMEQEAKDILGKFVSSLANRTQDDFASKMEEKLAELKKAESKILSLQEENQILLNKLEDGQNNIKMLESQNQQNQILLFNLTTTEKSYQAMQIEFQNAILSHNKEIELKNFEIKKLEEESTKLKIDANSLQNKTESMSLEMVELHSAMASLHGEISALQRECEESQEKEHLLIKQKKDVSILLESKENEIIKLRNEKNLLDLKSSQQEHHLLEIAERYSQLQLDYETKLQNFGNDKMSTQNTLVVMEAKVKQQSETNQELNSLLGRMRSDLMTAQKELDSQRQAADEHIHQIVDLQNTVKNLSVSKKEADEIISSSKEEHMNMLRDLTTLTERNEKLTTENKKQSKRLERLEREKQDLFMDLSTRTQDHEGTRKLIQDTEAKVEELRRALDTEQSLKSKVLEESALLLTEVEQLRSACKDQRESLASLERQYKEECRLREQATEGNKQQQRENANRIVEFSQKNAKLSAESQSMQEELANSKKVKEELLVAFKTVQREKEEVAKQYAAASTRLQDLEDAMEELTLRLQASESQADDFRSKLQSLSDSKSKEIAALKQHYESERDQLQGTLQRELEEKLNAANIARKQQEQGLERSLARTKESFQKQMEELQTSRQKEVQDARNRTAAVAKAMESMQAALREESEKNAALTEELSVLRDIVESGGGEAQQRVQQAERERAKERARLEGQLYDLKEQLKLLTEQKTQRELQVQTVEQQLSQERDARFACQQKTRVLEEESAVAVSALEAMTVEVNDLRASGKEQDRRLALTLQSKEAEIQRLQRRNEVLSEAVARLTQATSLSPSKNNWSFPSDNNSTSSTDRTASESPWKADAGKSTGENNLPLTYQKLTSEQYPSTYQQPGSKNNVLPSSTNHIDQSSSLIPESTSNGYPEKLVDESTGVSASGALPPHPQAHPHSLSFSLSSPAIPSIAPDYTLTHRNNNTEGIGNQSHSNNRNPQSNNNIATRYENRLKSASFTSGLMDETENDGYTTTTTTTTGSSSNSQLHSEVDSTLQRVQHALDRRKKDSAGATLAAHPSKGIGHKASSGGTNNNSGSRSNSAYNTDSNKSPLDSYIPGQPSLQHSSQVPTQPQTQPHQYSSSSSSNNSRNLTPSDQYYNSNNMNDSSLERDLTGRRVGGQEALPVGGSFPQRIRGVVESGKELTENIPGNIDYEEYEGGHGDQAAVRTFHSQSMESLTPGSRFDYYNIDNDDDGSLLCGGGAGGDFDYVNNCQTTKGTKKKSSREKDKDKERGTRQSGERRTSRQSASTISNTALSQQKPSSKGKSQK